MDDLDKPKETPSQRAERKWKNHDLTKRFLEERKAKLSAPTPKEIEPADVIETERPKADTTTKFERQFIKDLRAMLEGHTRRNLLLYKLSLRIRIDRLKRERARRLQAQVAQQKPKDLFS